mgnify:CR=1 FL=1
MLPLRGACRSLRFVMMISNRFGLLQSCALTSRSVPPKASSCHPRLRLAIQGFVLYQGFALPSRSVPSKASSCHQGPAKHTSGQSHAHQSQSLYDRSPPYHHVMSMALMLAIAMMTTAMQRCTSIVRARGSRPATLSTKRKRQQHQPHDPRQPAPASAAALVPSGLWLVGRSCHLTFRHRWRGARSCRSCDGPRPAPSSPPARHAAL